MKELIGFLFLIAVVGLLNVEYSTAQNLTPRKQNQVQINSKNRQFVDLNKDGRCDNFIDANNDGVCDNCKRQGYFGGTGTGRRLEIGSGRGMSLRIRQFVDENNDGICDNYQNRQQRWRNLRLKK